jgi:hypothetical protein
MKNIIELTQKIVKDFPKISDFWANDEREPVHIDWTEPLSDTYGLSPIGDVKVSEDILGNEKRIHKFHLYAMYQSQSDYDRLANSGLLLELQNYLEHTTDINFEFEDKKRGCLDHIEVSNGMLYDVPSENMVAPVIYQVQLQVYYKIFV